ncbi:hypothetical protein RCL_jg28906.t1 [Rhizophagus clarus]|uniref:Integrase catalytic domain-containing protein n=1 Tax=Rhizophagus clarus TaxID=94130 RepID=A0A8H3LWL6_9GLOM|nr:hypothetical protein RCL_jg28906.t1 [Rhizophagus clarus]
MGEPVIYIDPQKARELDQIIVKQTPTINIDPQKAHNLDQHLALQKLYYRPEGLYQNVKGLWDACKKASYSFSFIDSSKEVAEAFKSIYDNPDKPLNWPRKLQCDKSTEFMGYVTLLMDEHGVEIRRIIAHFRHTSFAMIDNYARHFSRRVFKNQYSVEFHLPTGKRCRECERFARRIVNNMNDSLTRLIGMNPNDATKLERIYSKPSVKYNHPIGVDELQLPKGTTIQFLLAPGEWENDPFERCRITDLTWSSSLHKIWRIVIGKNPPMPILYYLDESGPQQPFVREQLMHIKEEPMLPSRWVLGYNQMHTRRSL